MIALLLVPILVSGYILVVGNLYHYYQLHRYEGQLLYIKVAAHGTISVVFVVTIAAIIKFLFPEFHPIGKLSEILHVKKIIDSNKAATWLALISIASIFSSFLWVFLVWCKNIYYGYRTKTKNHESIIHSKNLRILRQTISNSTLDKMLLDAMDSSPKIPILLTLSSRKVYVGIVNGVQEPTESEAPNQYISIFPLMSGYREKDTLQIYFTNAYPSEIEINSDTTSNSVKTHKIKYMDILIKADEVTHFSWFDFDLYLQVNDSLSIDLTNIEP